MNSQDAKIQFLQRMNSLNGLYSDLALFLLREHVVSNLDVSRIMAKAEDARATEFYVVINKNIHRFDLVDWEWTILPVENMRLMFVTANGVKEFVWNG